VPKYVRFTDEYPLTVTGKIKKNVMRGITDEMLAKKDAEI
jgi:acyl-coenzyme A synthetase/AMP-(fatty) acid ligase